MEKIDNSDSVAAYNIAQKEPKKIEGKEAKPIISQSHRKYGNSHERKK